MKTAVLLLNTGTPDSPETPDVRRFLFEFLNDGRVIDIPLIPRTILVNMIIVPFRAPKVSKLYKKIWTKEGSPLVVHTKTVKAGLQNLLGDEYIVDYAMRYGNPSIESTIDRLLKAGIKKLIVFPMFPQYASASTGSVKEEVMRVLKGKLAIPELVFTGAYYAHDAFIKPWLKIAAQYDLTQYDHVLFTYHGLPERQVKKTTCDKQCAVDPDCCAVLRDGNAYCYRAQCFETTRRIAAGMNLRPDQYSITFQSRLGRTPWIKPYTDEVIPELPKHGKKKILVFSPSFVADCLETVMEIGIEYKELFMHNGGERFDLAPCLNGDSSWIEAIRDLVHADKA